MVSGRSLLGQSVVGTWSVGAHVLSVDGQWVFIEWSVDGSEWSVVVIEWSVCISE